MTTCPECAAEHLPGTLFCDRCGAAVHPAAQLHVGRAAPPRLSPFVEGAPAGASPARRRPETLAPPAAGELPPALAVAIVHRRHNLVLRATVIHIGRADPDAEFSPELDLTPFDGLERGVSRRHATIQWATGGFVLIDQHSNNGTWLEGVRLAPGYAYQLPPQATVRFGDLVVQLVVEGS